MKILFLNAWGGKIREPLAQFLEAQSRNTDIFCFQEAYDEMKQLARKVLPGYAEIERYKYVTDDDNFPQTTYIKNTIPLLASGTIMEQEAGLGLGLYARVRSSDNRDLFVCNFHGMSRPVNKLDDPARIRQSELLIDFFREHSGPAVIGGDFNLFPETKSVAMFAENGYRDLIKEYGIATTRNHFSWDLYPDHKQYHSDYVFTSPDIAIKHFSVPGDEISDHQPLILEID
jgi:endonuclease/exonuclease/phosphatase family metal-dependent hydrolase